MLKSKHLSFIIYTLIIILSIFILHHYIKVAFWALIIVVSVWPAYLYWDRKIKKKYRALSAFSFTLLVAIVIILPIAWMAYIAINEFITLVTFLTQSANQNTLQLPSYISSIPYIGDDINKFWDQNIANPDQLKLFVSHFPISYSKASEIAIISFKIVADFFFMLLILFFMFLNGQELSITLHKVTKNKVPHFNIYLEKIVLVIRSVLTSMIYTGIGTGVILGLLFYIIQLPLAAFFGIVSMLATAIPFGIVVVLFVVCAILIVQSKITAMVMVIIIGSILSLVIDNWLRPKILEKYISMHFLAAFFGVFRRY